MRRQRHAEQVAAPDAASMSDRKTAQPWLARLGTTILIGATVSLGTFWQFSLSFNTEADSGLLGSGPSVEPCGPLRETSLR